jgi:hypothetical protein
MLAGLSPSALLSALLNLHNKNASESAPGMVPGANPENKTRTSDNTMNKTYYLGLDVHKEKIAIAYAPEGGGEEPAYYGKCAASVQNTERTLRKLAKKLGVEFRGLKDYFLGVTLVSLIRFGSNCADFVIE